MKLVWVCLVVLSCTSKSAFADASDPANPDFPFPIKYETSCSDESKIEITLTASAGQSEAAEEAAQCKNIYAKATEFPCEIRRRAFFAGITHPAIQGMGKLCYLHPGFPGLGPMGMRHFLMFVYTHIYIQNCIAKTKASPCEICQICTHPHFAQGFWSQFRNHLCGAGQHCGVASGGTGGLCNPTIPPLEPTFGGIIFAEQKKEKCPCTAKAETIDREDCIAHNPDVEDPIPTPDEHASEVFGSIDNMTEIDTTSGTFAEDPSGRNTTTSAATAGTRNASSAAVGGGVTFGAKTKQTAAVGGLDFGKQNMAASTTAVEFAGNEKHLRSEQGIVAMTSKESALSGAPKFESAEKGAAGIGGVRQGGETNYAGSGGLGGGGGGRSDGGGGNTGGAGGDEPLGDYLVRAGGSSLFERVTPHHARFGK